jgi:hypothetical protein
MRRLWGQLGGQLGLACIGIGLLVIGIGWNGAAGIDFVSGQLPYLLSGGALGLALVVLGAALLVVQNQRRDRNLLEAQLRDLNVAVTRLANAVAGSPGALNGHGRDGTQVAVGRSSFHRPDCRLAEGKGLALTTLDAAQAEGLTPCRICRPDELEAIAVS